MKSAPAFHSKGIVVSKESFGEADLYIHFFTKDWGLISVLAKSAKKSKRRYVGGLDLFCHDEIFLRGDPRERPYLNELSVLNSFQGIREQLEKLLLAGKVTQWVNRLANVATPMPAVYSLLGQTLALIEQEADESRLELLGLVFKAKFLGELGLKPRVDACARCDTPLQDEVYFDIAAGGILCKTCSLKSPLQEYLRLDHDDRAFLHVIDDVKLARWKDFRMAPIRASHLSRLLNQFASYHTHARLPV